MEQISISFDKDISKVREIVNSYSIAEEINIEEGNIGNRFFLKFKIDDNKKNQSSLYFYKLISHIITDIIILIYSREIIGRKAYKKCIEYGQQEKMAIINIAYEFLTNRDYFNEEKEYIYDEILNYVMEHEYIAIDGFVNFRLKKFKNNMNRLMERSIDRFVAEKEYKEFIKILQYFVDIQEPKLPVVNVIIHDEEHKLYDHKNELINSDFFSDVANELQDEGIGNDDLLISSLIVIAPQKIIIHVKEEEKDKDIIKVIKNVFSHRVYFCSDCELCSIKKSIKKEKR